MTARPTCFVLENRNIENINIEVPSPPRGGREGGKRGQRREEGAEEGRRGRGEKKGQRRQGTERTPPVARTVKELSLMEASEPPAPPASGGGAAPAGPGPTAGSPLLLPSVKRKEPRFVGSAAPVPSHTDSADTRSSLCVCVCVCVDGWVCGWVKRKEPLTRRGVWQTEDEAYALGFRLMTRRTP